MGGARPLFRMLAVLTTIAGLAVLPSTASAHAQPPGFPDLDAFTEAPANLHFSRPVRWASGYAFFRTPDGISCMVGSLTRCSGPLPGLPAETNGACPLVLRTYEQATRSAPFRFETTTDGCKPTTDDLLDVGQKLTFTASDTTTCVVGVDRLTACIQNDHGFVLQPAGSWVF